jgi:hypothetical protein
VSSEVSEPAGSDRSAIRIAYIAALFGVIGTLCGSAVTYLGNRTLQNQQINQQNAVEATATRAAARIAVFRYQTYENLVNEMLSQRQYYEQQLPQPLSAGNEALIVASLDTDGLDALALADLGTTFVSGVLKGKPDGAPLHVGDQVTLEEASTDLQKGLAVLKRIATRRLS